MDGRRSTLSNLSSALGEYFSLKTDDFKGRLISGLSVGFSRVLSILVMVMLLMIVLALFAFAFVTLLGDAIGSLSGAAFIVGGVYLLALTILFLMRKKLFLGMFSDLFTGIIDSGTQPDNWKALALVLVRYIRSLVDE